MGSIVQVKLSKDVLVYHSETRNNIENWEMEAHEWLQQRESQWALIIYDFPLVKQKHVCIFPEACPVWIILNTHDYCLLSFISGGGKWG